MKQHIAHILVVDDDTRIRELLWRYLQENGFFVSTAKDAQEAGEILADFCYDLVILDVMMPEENGISFTTRLRHSSAVPILMLTAMGETEDRIAGLESGADDYLPKPFEPRELLLRIERILNRTRQVTRLVLPKAQIVAFGTMEFNCDNNRLSQNGTLIPLTSGEAKLLSVLVQNRGMVVARERLAELCGGVNERSIDVQIIRLRTKIEPDPKKTLPFANHTR
jgi:two-component system phosphate regulon response regulator OmpR